MQNQSYQLKQIQPNSKGLIAKKKIQKSTEIMQIQPIAWTTLQSTKDKYCNWCLLQKQLVKCSQCKSFYYCSTQCQKKDWKYHKVQCKIYKKMVNQKNLSIHKQITTQFVLNTRLYFVLQQNKQIANKFYNEMCSLDDYQPLQKRQHFQQLAVIMMENIGLQKTQANMSQLIKQFNIVSVNAFTIQDPFFTTDGIAVGLFYPACFINHDCGANCIQIFDGRYLKIVANKAIQPQDELTISYISALELYKDRSKFLKQNYFFECFCEICLVEKMLNTEVIYIKCPKCKQARVRKIGNVDKQLEEDIRRQMKESKGQNQQKSQNKQENGQVDPKKVQQPQNSSKDKFIKYQCTNCQAAISPQYLQQMCQKIQSLPSQVQKLQTYKQKKQLLLSLKKQVDLKHPAFCKALQIVYICAIDQALLSQQQDLQKKYFNQSYILLSQILKNLSSWYKLSEQQLTQIRFFNKFNQMSKLAYNMNKMQKCSEYLQKALKCIQKLKFKNKYKQIQELKKRYDQIKIEMSIAKTKAMK